MATTQPRHAASGGAQSPSGARPGANQTQRRFSDQELEEASVAFEMAFSILGLVRDGVPVCPECGTDKPKKVVFKKAKCYWKCYACGAHGTLLGAKSKGVPGMLEQYGGYTWIDQVNALLGRPVASRGNIVVVPTVVVASHDFQAVLDIEVYDSVVAGGDVEAAKKFFGRWHISPEAVVESGTVVITGPDKLTASLFAKFGRDRLVACGLIKAGEDGKPDIPMFSKNYPVVEVHRRPDGHVVGMQFRASEAQEKLVKGYAGRKAEYEAAKVAYEAKHGEGSYDPKGQRKPRYQPKFMSLAGGIVGEHLVGCGLPRINKLPPEQRIYIVEGFKDMLAARTLGVEAYAIPGVGVMPPEKVCRILARHTAVICMDADEGGDRGRAALEEVLTANNVPFVQKDPPLPAGFDVTDELVNRRAKRGCKCETCTAWRAKHPDTAATPKR